MGSGGSSRLTSTVVLKRLVLVVRCDAASPVAKCGPKFLFHVVQSVPEACGQLLDLIITASLNGIWGLSHGEESWILCEHQKFNFCYGSICFGGGIEKGPECGVSVVWFCELRCVYLAARGQLAYAGLSLEAVNCEQIDR